VCSSSPPTAQNTLYYTEDGGQSWHQGSGHVSYNDVEMVTPQVGFASGLGEVNKTVDGGRT
jgi:hypothetical protein